MNFKTPFKVLTTAALVGALSLSAVAPGAASASEKSTQSVQAKEAADYAISQYILTKTGSAPIIISADKYQELFVDSVVSGKSFNEILNGYAANAVVTTKGAVFTLETYTEAFVDATVSGANKETEALLESLDKAGKSTEKPADLAEAKVDENGKLVEGEKVPTEETGDFKVTEIAAITESGVEVSFPALTADKEDVTIEVKDSKDAVRAVKAINISKGDTKATFEFETKVAASDLTGQWKIGEATYDFDAIAQLDAIKSAATANNAVKLLAALKAAGITDVSEKDADLEKYVAEIVKADVKTLTDVQEAVATANEEIAKENSTTTAVDAVEKATGQVSLLAALQDGFKRVNADWIGKYAGGSATTSTAASVIGFIPAKGDTKTQVVTAVEEAKAVAATGAAKAVTPANIQSTIDAINTVEIQKAWNTAWNSAKSEDLAKVVALADYIADDTDEQKEAKAAAADTAKLLEAVIKVNTVAESTATNGTFEKALQELDVLENSLVEKYKGTGYAVTDKLNLTTVKAEQLADYRKELKSITEGKQKNQPSDIQHVINKVNSLKAVSLLTNLETKASTVNTLTAQSTETEVSKAKTDFLKALKDLVAFDTETFKDVTIVDSRVEAYATALKNVDLTTSTLEAADNATADATVTKVAAVKTDLGTAKTKINAANNGALTTALTAVKEQAVVQESEKADFLKALQSPELNLANIIVANKDAYVANAATLKTKATPTAETEAAAKEAQKALQAEVNKVNALTAFNEAKTVAEAEEALKAFKYAPFTNVGSADKAYVAEKALEARELVSGKKYATIANLEAALFVENGSDDTGVIATYNAVLDSYKTTLATAATNEVIAALEKLGVEVFNDSTNQDVIAEYFVENFPKDSKGDLVDYKTLAAAKADLEKAIEATK